MKVVEVHIYTTIK